jgi:hypothetical protein
MKIQAHKIYLPIFVLVILLQLYLPSFKGNIVIQIIALLFCAFLENISLSYKFLQYQSTLIILLCIGLIGTLLHRYKVYDFIKDVVHFIKPITGLLIGYVIFKRVNNFRLFLQTVVTASVISAVIHFFIIVYLVRTNPTLEDIREFTKDNFLELFGLFLIIYYKKIEGTPLLKTRLYTNVVIAILAISNILYFSRTMIIVAIILLFSVYGYTKINGRNIKIASTGLLALLLMYVCLYSANIQRGKPGVEGFLYKVKMAPEEIFTTRINRENQRDLWDHWRGYEAKRAIALMNSEPSAYIFGAGHGSLINLKFYAPLGSGGVGIRYISELHNGYMYILYKTGLLGILVYLILLGRWYCYIYKGDTFVNILISAIGIIYVSSTVTISGLYNGRDIIILILGGALYYAEQQNKKMVFIKDSHAQ